MKLKAGVQFYTAAQGHDVAIPRVDVLELWGSRTKPSEGNDFLRRSMHWLSTS